MSTAVRSVQLVLRAFGARGLARRAAYEAHLRSGLLARRLPTAPDFSGYPPIPWAHRVDLDEIRQSYEREGLDELVRDQVVADADRVLAGELQLYGDRWHDVGWPPRWHTNPFTRNSYPADRHWTEISDNDPDHGDIKDVWELSRLPFTYLFARAHVLTRDNRYVEQWWQAIEDWAEHNPPNTGPNWRCGQESSLRGIALCFGMSAFAGHRSSTPDRRDLVASMLGATVARVRPTVGYALSQRNNHAVSELVFLLSVRPGIERQWLPLLLDVLEDQFYPDGSYSQQSFTYQRLAVHALQWLLVVRPDLPPGVRSRVVDALARSRDFLARCSDPVSGWLPNYGPNDGALLFHLSDTHYRDFRPLLASLGRPFDAEHREPSLWLSLPEVAAHETDADGQRTTYHTLRGPRSLAFTRIGTGRHRPGHADQQAIDLWIDGQNVVADPGTFRYTASAPWGNALTGLAVHSTLRSDDMPALSVARFLKESGPDAQLVHRADLEGLEVVISRRQGNDGWLWRALVRRGDAHAVIDIAEGVQAFTRWNLREADDVDVAWFIGGGPQPLDRDDQDPLSGWDSPLYGSRQPIEARESSMAPDAVRGVTFTPPGERPLAPAELHRQLSPWLPMWAVVHFIGTESHG